jgi:hypothetical protein
MINSYFKYLKERINAHGIHSPFVFEFYNEVLKKSKSNRQPAILKLHQQLTRNKTEISINDLGAGSRKNELRFVGCQTLQKVLLSARNTVSYSID